MKIQTLINLLRAFLLFSICIQCNTVELTEDLGPLVYLNSFESTQDTVAWTGYGGRVLKNDAPPGGGNRSLLVSGGCVVPHACYELKISGGGRFVLRCWGKNLALGGEVGLRVKNARCPGIRITVTDTVWTHYRPSDTLFCPTNDTVQLLLNSGGVVASAMLVDVIEIIKVN